jgi:CheY-like chemotaxis protein
MARRNRVLVVSPDPGLVNQVRGSLASCDVADVSDVATAEEALERLENGAPQLVIAEVDLPGITGHELCRRLKEVPGRAPAVALIFRDGDDRAAEQCQRVGADTTAARPFQAQDLTDRLLPFVTSETFVAAMPDPEGVADADGEPGSMDSVADESLYSDYEFGGDESAEDVRSIDTGSIRIADTAEMEAVKNRGEFDEVTPGRGDSHGDSSVKIASLLVGDLDHGSLDSFLPPADSAGRTEGGGGTLRDMVAEHLAELTGEGSPFRSDLRALIRDAVTDAVLVTARSAAGAEPESESEDS